MSTEAFPQFQSTLYSGSREFPLRH